MRDAFVTGAGAMGINVELIFMAHHYRVETFNGADDRLAKISVDSLTLPLALRRSLDKTCEEINGLLDEGMTAQSLVRKFEMQPGSYMTPAVVVEDGAPRTFYATGNWHAISLLIKEKYAPEMIYKPRPATAHRQFTVFDGGVA